LIDVVSLVAVMSSMPEDITILVAAEASVPSRIGVTLTSTKTVARTTDY
jgi:hypothetical protein